MDAEDVSIYYPFAIDGKSAIPTVYRNITPHLKFNVVSHTSDNGLKKYNHVTVSRYNSKNVLKQFLASYDIIQTTSGEKYLLGSLSKLNDSKIIHTVHAKPEDKRRKINQSMLIKQADLVTTVSQYLYEWVDGFSNVSNDLSITPNGIDMQFFDINNRYDSEKEALFAGRLEQNKNPDIIIQLAERMPSWDFIICGSGNLSDHIRREALRKENVRFEGWVNRKRLRSYYQESSVVLCPYVNEGFGLVPIEAMSCGTPVVGLMSGNLPNLIDPAKNGVLCETLELDEWEYAINRASRINNYNEIRDSVYKYSIKNVAENYNKVYRTLA